MASQLMFGDDAFDPSHPDHVAREARRAAQAAELAAEKARLVESGKAWKAKHKEALPALRGKQGGFETKVIAPEEYRVQAMRKKRMCLTCQEMFNSEGPHNRICFDCTSDNDRWGIPGEASAHISF